MKLKDVMKEIKSYAERVNTMIEHRECEFFESVIFMTDRFGGSYARVMQMANGDMKLDVMSDEPFVINDIESALEMVDKARKKMINDRNLESIYEMINEQYD